MEKTCKKGLMSKKTHKTSMSLFCIFFLHILCILSVHFKYIFFVYFSNIIFLYFDNCIIIVNCSIIFIIEVIILATYQFNKVPVRILQERLKLKRMLIETLGTIKEIFFIVK